MVNTFHSREARTSTFFKSIIGKFFALDTSFAFTGNCPAYIASVRSSYYLRDLR